MAGTLQTREKSKDGLNRQRAVSAAPPKVSAALLADPRPAQPIALADDPPDLHKCASPQPRSPIAERLGSEATKAVGFTIHGRKMP